MATGIYLLYIFFLISLFINISMQWKSLNIVCSLLTYLLALMFLLHFANTANVSTYKASPYDASSKRVIEKIMELNKGKVLDPESVSIGHNWIFEPSLTFYKFYYGLDWLSWFERNGPGGAHDYYYLLDKNNSLIRPQRLQRDARVIEKYNLKVIECYEYADTCLYIPSQ